MIFVFFFCRGLDFVSSEIERSIIFLFSSLSSPTTNHLFPFFFVSFSLSPPSPFIFVPHTLKPETKMSTLPDDLPYGWPGPSGNAAAERLAALQTSDPSRFSRKRAVAKEIVQAIKAVVGGVESVHEALLNALERGEVRKRRGLACGEKREKEKERDDDGGDDSKADSFLVFSLHTHLSPSRSLSSLRPKKPLFTVGIPFPEVANGDEEPREEAAALPRPGARLASRRRVQGLGRLRRPERLFRPAARHRGRDGALHAV